MSRGNFLEQPGRRNVVRRASITCCVRPAAENLLWAPSPAVGAEIARAVVRDARGQRDDGIGLTQVDAQVGVALIVLEQDVVFRHIVLDERAFEHERLELRRGGDRLKMIDIRHHFARFCIVRRRILKILADAVFQFFCLADVDHGPGGVFHQINARLIGQRQRGLLQFLTGHACSILTRKLPQTPPIPCVWGSRSC